MKLTASAKITWKLQREFIGEFMGIGCFNGIFSLQVKADNKLYQAPPRCIAKAIQGRNRVATAVGYHPNLRCG